MLGHVMAAAHAAGLADLAVVIGPDSGAVQAFVEAEPGAATYVQRERLGTAHAVLAARAALSRPHEAVVVVYGDTPLVRPATIRAAADRLVAGADLVIAAFEAEDPSGYGRVLTEGGHPVAIVEEKDADPTTRSVRLVNAGLMGFRAAHLPALLERIGAENAAGEHYLTDAVALAAENGLRIEIVIGTESEFLGVNDRGQLAMAEAEFQRRARATALTVGATLQAPETVFLAFDTELAADVTVEPHVVFGPGVSVESGARIRAFSHLEGARIAAGAVVGPFARLRPGTTIGPAAHIGNFVEVKNAVVGAGAKANHLTYLGDAAVGAGTNIGAGTITCNYDGVAKHRTDIGDGVFVGSNATLVAPVTIGPGAYVAAGSVVTDNVADESLAFGRARQVVKEGRAAALKARLKAARDG
jgi:bifunctional UDP-N-acetylglucosamine pyrophosphorylase/glucosamine-1-phosphate N-acetyltransferase